MALPFIPSDAAILCLQAGLVALPRPADPRLVASLRRFRGRGWALVPIASIVGVIFAIRYGSSTAQWLTDLALVAVPLLSVVALGWLCRFSRPWLGLLVVPLFLAAWQLPTSLVGEGAGALLSGLSCVALGVLLAAVCPPGWLRLGVVAMAAADVWLVASDLLQHPNSELVAAAPPAGLPQLQAEQFGSVSMGYGDLFVAGVLGALLASSEPRAAVARRVSQAGGAVLTLVFAGLFDLLFLVVNELPATVPVALTVIVVEVWGRFRPAGTSMKGERRRKLGFQR